MCYVIAITLMLSQALSDGRSKGSRVQIELDVFSGRPNPTWTLNDEEAKEFLAKFKALATSDSNKPLYDGLGYRGFKAAGFQDYDEVTVWNGNVEARRGEKTYRWRDQGKGLEKYLLKISKEHVDDKIYKLIESSVEKD